VSRDPQVLLPGFLNSLAGPLGHYGLWAVLLFVLIEDFGISVPGETVLIGFFDRHGAWIIMVARFIEGLRQANGIIAGITGMHWLRFLAFNALGAALWVGTWVSVGYLAGSHVDTIYSYITRYSTYALIAAGVIIAALIARHLLRRRRARAQPCTTAPRCCSSRSSGRWPTGSARGRCYWAGWPPSRCSPLCSPPPVTPRWSASPGSGKAPPPRRSPRPPAPWSPG
jgi:hypothetical protein